MKTLILFLSTFLFRSDIFGQSMSYKLLTGGTWKDINLPDSIAFPDNSIHPSIVFSFHFNDSSKVDVRWNGFLFKEQLFEIDKTNNIVYVHIVSKIENVRNMLWLIKYIDNKTIKAQGSAKFDTHPNWIKKETVYNTYTFQRYAK